jgi:peptidoglycan/LPS O-acetylase OafA/YrhL
LTFTTDFLRDNHPTPTGHLWSLGVEEQFYLLWPCLLVLILNRANCISKLLKVLTVPLIVAPAVRLMYYKQWYPESLQFLFIDASFFSKFDSLAYGCLAAIFFNNWRNPLEMFYRKNSCLVAFGGMALVFSPWLLPFHGRFRAAGFESLQAIGFSLLLLQSVLNPRHGFYRFLNWKWVSHVGVLSYSIYIWQQMFCGTSETVFGVKSAWWLNFPLWILTALLAAHASYYLLEKPFLKLRAKFHPA